MAVRDVERLDDAIGWLAARASRLGGAPMRPAVRCACRAASPRRDIFGVSSTVAGRICSQLMMVIRNRPSLGAVRALRAFHCGAAAAGARSLGGVSTAGGRRRRVRICVIARWTSRRRPCGAGASRSGGHPQRREEGLGIRKDGAAVRERQAGLGAAGWATRSTRRRYANAYARCERPTRATTAARTHRPPLPRRPRRRPPLFAARCRRGADPIDAPSTTRPRSMSTSPAGRSR